MDTHKYGHGETRNKKLTEKKRCCAVLLKDDRSAVFNIALEKGRGKKGKKKQLLEHGVFEFGHPSKY